jgi:plastocyanin
MRPAGLSPIMRLLRSICSVLALVACALRAPAATLDIIVTDAASAAPLADAVFMLEPASGRLPVKTMSGVQIAQRERQFTPRITVVTVGTAVAFPNFDTVRHHVYSFSPVKTFELKLYAGVPREPVVFDKPGVAVLGCNIHDQMAAWVIVVDTPLYARSAADGRARIENVPVGSYRLRVWHASVGTGEPASMPLVVDESGISRHIALGTRGIEVAK